MAVLRVDDMMCDHCVERIKNGLEDADIPVSYTHLDVYKRQLMNLSQIRQQNLRR